MEIWREGKDGGDWHKKYAEGLSACVVLSVVWVIERNVGEYLLVFTREDERRLRKLADLIFGENTHLRVIMEPLVRDVLTWLRMDAFAATVSMCPPVYPLRVFDERDREERWALDVRKE